MKYTIECQVPAHVARKQLEVVRRLRANPEKGEHTAQMVDALVELAEALLEFFFVRPFTIMEVGSMTRKMVNMGIRSGLSIISKLGKRAFAGLDREQLLAYADYLESLISVQPDDTADVLPA